jgi:hypothetical protein
MTRGKTVMNGVAGYVKAVVEINGSTISAGPARLRVEGARHAPLRSGTRPSSTNSGSDAAS